MIKYWTKILKADDSNLVKRVYLVLKAECEENNPTNGQGNIFPVVKFQSDKRPEKNTLLKKLKSDKWLNVFSQI